MRKFEQALVGVALLGLATNASAIDRSRQPAERRWEPASAATDLNTCAGVQKEITNMRARDDAWHASAKGKTPKRAVDSDPYVKTLIDRERTLCKNKLQPTRVPFVHFQ